MIAFNHHRRAGGAPPVSYALDYIAAVQAAGGVLTVGQQAALLQFEAATLAAGLLHPTQRRRSLVLACYPFAGGTAASHAINFVEPGLFDLRYVQVNGFITHSAAGIGFDGSAGQGADTLLNPNDWLSLESIHSACYLNQPTTNNTAEFNAISAGSAYYGLYSYYQGTAAFVNGTVVLAQTPVAGSTGWTCGSRTASNAVGLYRNAGQIGTDNRAANGWPGGRICIGSPVDSFGGGYQAHSCNGTFGFASVGFGLTDSQNAAYYQAVHALQIAFARQV